MFISPLWDALSEVACYKARTDPVPWPRSMARERKTLKRIEPLE